MAYSYMAYCSLFWLCENVLSDLMMVQCSYGWLDSASARATLMLCANIMRMASSIVLTMVRINNPFIKRKIMRTFRRLSKPKMERLLTSNGLEQS